MFSFILCIMGKINFLFGRAMLLPVKSSRIPSDFTVGGGTRGDASFFYQFQQCEVSLGAV